eukprot:COSAG02_NODE_21481_length_786_cov_1.231441_1_plen_27_part_10
MYNLRNLSTLSLVVNFGFARRYRLLII